MAHEPISTTENIKKRQQVERIRSKMELERSAWIQHWRDLSDYILPRRTRFLVDDDNEDRRSDRRSTKIIDSTATRAARTLQSGLHSGVTSPARPWFKLTTPDPDLANYAPVKLWLHAVTNLLLTMFLKSNIYNALPTLYGDFGTFGSPAMGVMEDDRELLRAYSYPIGSFSLACSNRDLVDSFAMEYKMTVRQIIEEFAGPSNDPDFSHVSRQVKNLWDTHKYENKVDICWMVIPNPDFDPEQTDAKFKPWASLYWEKASTQGTFLRESGFDEFPILAPRWHVTGRDWYASDCPGMTCLSDVRALQIMQRRKAQAVEIGINPSLQGPATLMGKKVSLRPGEVTFLDQISQSPNSMLTPIREVNLNALRFFQGDIQDTRQGINESYFKDLFLMISSLDQAAPNAKRTATEISQRHEEKLLALGPVYERMNDELLDPLVDRAYAMMDRRGEIPPPPQELEGMKLKVEYISILAQAMKQVAVSGLSGFLGSTVPLFESMPNLRFKIDEYALVDEYADLFGVNPKIVVPTEDAQKAAQAAQQQAQKQQQMEQAELLSKTAKNLSGANPDDNNALQRVLQGASS